VSATEAIFVVKIVKYSKYVASFMCCYVLALDVMELIMLLGCQHTLKRMWSIRVSVSNMKTDRILFVFRYVLYVFIGCQS